jgi:hypothetical protein
VRGKLKRAGWRWLAHVIKPSRFLEVVQVYVPSVSNFKMLWKTQGPEFSTPQKRNKNHSENPKALHYFEN